MTITWHVDDLKISHVNGMTVIRNCMMSQPIYRKVRNSQSQCKTNYYIWTNPGISDSGIQLSCSSLKELDNSLKPPLEVWQLQLQHFFDTREDREHKKVGKERVQVFCHDHISSTVIFHLQQSDTEEMLSYQWHLCVKESRNPIEIMTLTSQNAC